MLTRKAGWTRAGVQRRLARMVRSVDVIPRVRAVLERAPLRWAYLFGSCARGPEGRDVDIAIMPEVGAYPTAVAWGSLIAELEPAAGTTVDLVDLRTAHLPIASAVLSARVMLVDRERDHRHAWEADTTSRWLDFKPAWERYSRVRNEAAAARRRGVG